MVGRYSTTANQSETYFSIDDGQLGFHLLLSQFFNIVFTGYGDAMPYIVGGLIPQQPGSLTDVGKTMSHIRLLKSR